MNNYGWLTAHSNDRIDAVYQREMLEHWGPSLPKRLALHERDPDEGERGNSPLSSKFRSKSKSAESRSASQLYESSGCSANSSKINALLPSSERERGGDGAGEVQVAGTTRVASSKNARLPSRARSRTNGYIIHHVRGLSSSCFHAFGQRNITARSVNQGEITIGILYRTRERRVVNYSLLAWFWEWPGAHRRASIANRDVRAIKYWNNNLRASAARAGERGRAKFRIGRNSASRPRIFSLVARVIIIESYPTRWITRANDRRSSRHWIARLGCAIFYRRTRPGSLRMLEKLALNVELRFKAL